MGSSRLKGNRGNKDRGVRYCDLRRFDESESKRINALADRDRWKRAAEKMASALEVLQPAKNALGWLAWSLREDE